MSSTTDDESDAISSGSSCSVSIDSCSEDTANITMDPDHTQEMSFIDEDNSEEESMDLKDSKDSTTEKINKSMMDMSIAVDDIDGWDSGSEADDEGDVEEKDFADNVDKPKKQTPTSFIATTNSSTALCTLISNSVEVEVFDEDERELLGDDFSNERKKKLALDETAAVLHKSTRKSIVILSSGEEDEDEEEKREVVEVKEKPSTSLKLSLPKLKEEKIKEKTDGSSSDGLIDIDEEAVKTPTVKKEVKKPISPIYPLPSPPNAFVIDDDDELMIIGSPIKPEKKQANSNPALPPREKVIQPKLPTKAKLNLAKLAAEKKKAPAIINYNKLHKSTRYADKAEKEHVRRVEAKEKVFKKTFDADDPATRRILDFDIKTGKVLVKIHASLDKHLKPHQVDGVKFMYESVIESVERLRLEEENEDEEGGSGCILAHSMGLGKTLQVVTFLHTILTNRHTQDAIERILIVVPYNVIENWAQEFDKWVEKCRLDWVVNIYEMRLEKTVKKRVSLLRTWYKHGGILLITNTLFSRIVSSLEDLVEKDRLAAKAFKGYLLSPGPDMVIIDEGHLLKNENSQLNQALQQIETRRRIILTGTPLQNNLAEYYTMVDYVKRNLLGTRDEFKNRFQGPIELGQNKDSAPFEVTYMKKRIHVLFQLLRSVIHRCDYSILVPYLPPKCEYVLSVSLTKKQIDMYQYYLDFYADKPADGSKVRKNLFRDKNMLSLIWTHPILIHDYKEESDGKDNFVSTIGNWYLEFVQPELDANRLELSSKLTLLFAILDACESLGDKVVIFSQSLLVLNLIERLLRVKRKEALEAGRSDGGRWCKGVDYFRIDGGVDSTERTDVIKTFNDPEEVRARLMLVSTRAGGIGINLVGANRAIIFDASFNPANDLQAIFRIYRLGQTKPVYVYRMIAFGTMEEKIYKKQILKQSLSRRVIDEQQVVRHYKKVELEELYKLEADYSEYADAVLPFTEKDDLLSDLILKHKGLVLALHEHDSLLEQRDEDDLTAEERQAAWDEFEKAKKEEERLKTGGDGGVSANGAGRGGSNGGGGRSLEVPSDLDQSGVINNTTIDYEEVDDDGKSDADNSYKMPALPSSNYEDGKKDVIMLDD